MLHINKTLIRLSNGFRGWILVIAALKIVVLLGITMFANSIGTLLSFLLVPNTSTIIKYLIPSSSFDTTSKARPGYKKERNELMEIFYISIMHFSNKKRA